MDDFPVEQKLPTLTQEIENLSRQITRDKIGNVIVDLPLKKESGSNSFAVQFYLTFKEEIIPILFTLNQKRGKKLKFTNEFYKASKPKTKTC